MLSLPMFLTSCEDILGEWSKPTPVNVIVTPDDNGGGTTAAETYKLWNGTAFVDTPIPSDVIEITNTTTTFGAGTYIVKGDVTLSGIIFTGDAKVILCDGAKLTVNGVFESQNDPNPPYKMLYSMEIYGQEGNTGKLITSVDDGSKGMWFNNLTIHGGDISVTATNDFAYPEGLYIDNDFKIHGGKLAANGCSRGIMVDNDITVTGGTITAQAGLLGSGYGGEGIHAAGTFTVEGGMIIATAGDAKASSNGNGGDGINAKLTVNDGYVSANGGAGDGSGAAGKGVTDGTLVTLGAGVTFFTTADPDPSSVYMPINPSTGTVKRCVSIFKEP